MVWSNVPVGTFSLTAVATRTPAARWFTSTPVSITVVAPSPTTVKSVLTLLISPPGSGKISGPANGASLEINKSYVVTASPIGNWVFANWSGGTNSNNLSPLLNTPSLTFIMTSNLALQANFVMTNPFTAVAGIYNGLFSPTNGVTEEKLRLFHGHRVADVKSRKLQCEIVCRWRFLSVHRHI